MNLTLILAVDGRKFNNPFRDYEKELILCLKAWNNIYYSPIILVCPSIFPISNNTKKILLNYDNIKYIEDSKYYSEDITCGFDMKALAGKLVQQDYQYLITTEYILNIDLDMYLINKIPEKIFEKAKSKIIIGRYTNTKSLKDKINEGIIYKHKDPFDTGFILTKKDSGFYIKWEEDIKKIRSAILNNNPILEMEKVYINSKKHLESSLQIDSIEEWLISYYNEHNIMEIYSLYNYQYGEFYPKELLKNKIPIFYHYHLYEGFNQNIHIILNKIKSYGKR